MTTISCKVDENLKREAEDIFKDLGISMSMAINMFLRASVREYGLPFSTKLPTYEDSLKKMLEDSKDPKNYSPTFDSWEEAKKWIYDEN